MKMINIISLPLINYCRFGKFLLKESTVKMSLAKVRINMKTGTISFHSLLETTVVLNIYVKCMRSPVCNNGLWDPLSVTMFKYLC